MSKIVLRRSRSGLRLMQQGAVLSLVRPEPGPTGNLLDVVAAAVAVANPATAIVVLGFGAGGIVAPLRALGLTGPIEAVDLDASWEAEFRAVSAYAVGSVRVTEAEARAWLARRRQRYDVIVEDLSERHPALQAVKPRVSVTALPLLIERRLAPRGTAIFNLLPSPGFTWDSLIRTVAARFRPRFVLTFDDYENRLVVCGGRYRSAHAYSRALRSRLRRLRPRSPVRFAVRKLP